MRYIRTNSEKKKEDKSGQCDMTEKIYFLKVPLRKDVVLG